MPSRSEKVGISFLGNTKMKAEKLPELCHESRKNDFEVENYLCQSDCSRTRRKHSGRKYCSFCCKIHGTFTVEEGFEKFYQPKPQSKRAIMKELLQQGNSPRQNVKESEESRSNSSSVSSSLISVTGEKMYKMTKHMASEKIYREKGIVPFRSNSPSHSANVYKRTCSSHEYNHHGDDYDRLVIKVVMPKMSF